MLVKPVVTTVLIALFLVACGAPRDNGGQDGAAEAVYLNGLIYTVDPDNPRAEAVAIRDGEFVAVGTDEDIHAFVGDETEVVDLGGQMVLPGLYDSHIHPVDGMLQERYNCNFPFTGTLEDAAVAVAACAGANPDRTWISGGQWNAGVLDTTIPTKEMLDAVVPDRPVYLADATYHHAWVNSRALELAGITIETPDPPGGTIVRDEVTGEAVGTLLETATRLVSSRIPPYSEDEYIAAALAIQARMNGFGFTAMKSAHTSIEHLETYKRLDDEGRLTIRVGTHLSYVDPAAAPDRIELLDATIGERRRYGSDLIRTDFIKFVLDGVPPSHTAAYIEPYLNRPDFHGEVLVPQDTLDALSTRFDAMGLTIKYHAAGDRAARVAINAIEAARRENGASGLKHEIGHASLIHPDDIPRLAELGGVAEVSPILWYPSPFILRAHYNALGEERAERLWPVSDYVDAGVLTVAGSDWPAAVASPNPWPAIEALVTRENPYGEMPGTKRGAAYAVPLETAIRMYTLNGAIAMGIGDTAGSIEAGKTADMIVLDRNIFEIPPADIDGTEVTLTLLEGKAVYRN